MDHALAGRLPAWGDGLRMGAVSGRGRPAEGPPGPVACRRTAVRDLRRLLGSMLPAPAILPLWWAWPPERRKEVKRARWLSTNDFSRVQRRVNLALTRRT